MRAVSIIQKDDQIRMSAIDSRLIPIDFIDEPEIPMRSQMDAETLTELVDSIKTHGIIEPIILRPKGTRFEIVAGHRRFLASKRALLSEIPAIIRSLGDVEAELLKFAENFAREDADPLAQAQAFSRLAVVTGLAPGPLAEKLGVSESFFRSRVALLLYQEDVKHALAQKLIPLSVAKLLSQITDDSVRLDYLQNVIANGATSYTVAIWVMDWQRLKGYRPAAETIELAPLSEDQIKAILAQHPNCDFCAQTLYEKRRVMMIICGPCWELWNQQVIETKARKIVEMGSSALSPVVPFVKNTVVSPT